MRVSGLRPDPLGSPQKGTEGGKWPGVDPSDLGLWQIAATGHVNDIFLKISIVVLNIFSTSVLTF